MLKLDYFSQWLDLKNPVEMALAEEFKLDETSLRWGQVSRAVNNAKHNSSECVRFLNETHPFP